MAGSAGQVERMGVSRSRRALPALGHLVPVRSERPSQTVTARVGAALTVLTCVVATAVVPGVGVVSSVSVAALVPAALVDLDERRLPNRLVAIAAALTAAVLALSVGVDLALGLDADVAGLLGDVGIGIGLMAGPLLVMHLASPAAMGFGDVKAAAVLGSGLGTVDAQLPLVALLLASAATAAWGLATRRRSLPFGPGLVVGSAWTLALSGVVVGGVG